MKPSSLIAAERYFGHDYDKWAACGDRAEARWYFTDPKGKTSLSKEYRLMYWEGASWKIYQVNAFWDYKNAK